MQPTSPAAVRELLQRHGLSPRKGLGQHFLWQQNIVEKIAGAAELDKSDVVVEIGPGLGILTAALARRSGLVISVEIDQTLFPVLGEVLEEFHNVRLVPGDARKMDYRALVERYAPGVTGWKVAGNLPYYLTSHLLAALLCDWPQAEDLVFMVQQEVAERIVAAPGGKDYGTLSLLAGYYTRPELLFTVKPQCFYPPPAVTSAVIRLRRRPCPAVAVRDEELFFKVVQGAFRYRRKTIHNSLRQAGLGDHGRLAEALNLAGIDPKRRGETLNLEEFARLTDSIYTLRERKVADALCQSD